MGAGRVNERTQMIEVSESHAGDRQQALELLYAHLAPNERQSAIEELLAAVADEQYSLDGLLTARLHGQLVGVMLTIAQADSTLFLWPPVVSETESGDSVADSLLTSIRKRIDASEHWIGQCLLDPSETSHREALSRNGFPWLTDLVFMQKILDDSSPEHCGVNFETIPFELEINRDHFAQVLGETYLNSQDCPEINGLRTGSEALQSHMAAGRFRPELWKIYRVNGQDVGVLLLSEHPDQKACEVVYMGIAENARGKGLGRAMLVSGLNDARKTSAESVLLAVDSRNHSAKRIYDELNFLSVGVRSVHCRIRQQIGPQK